MGMCVTAATEATNPSRPPTLIHQHVKQLLVGAHARQRDGHYRALGVGGQGLDEGSLAGAWGAPQQEPQLLGVALWWLGRGFVLGLGLGFWAGCREEEMIQSVAVWAVHSCEITHATPHHDAPATRPTPPSDAPGWQTCPGCSGRHPGGRSPTPFRGGRATQTSCPRSACSCWRVHRFFGFWGSVSGSEECWFKDLACAAPPAAVCNGLCRQPTRPPTQTSPP